MNALSSSEYLQLIGITQWQSRSTASEPAIDEWRSLETTVKQCRKCELANSRTNVVFGVGNMQADLMVIGEAPGYYEDKQGEPFVGRAGQLLTAMLHSIGIQREQVFIANVLKCRPPQNRDPLREEIRQCTSYLEQQIKLIQPKLIVALGRYAAHYLLNCDTSLTKLRKQMQCFSATDTAVLVTYHPAYLLRNPAAKREAYLDLLKISRVTGVSHQANF